MMYLKTNKFNVCSNITHFSIIAYAITKLSGRNSNFIEANSFLAFIISSSNSNLFAINSFGRF